MPAILRRALALVERDRPDAHAAMATALAGLRLQVDIDGSLILAGRAGTLHEESPAAHDGAASTAGTAPSAPHLRITGTRAALVALLRGDTTLLTALRTGALDIAGTTASLTRTLTAFEYLTGALLRLPHATDLHQALET